MAIRHWFDAVRSTQSTAIGLARSGAPPGTRVVAGRQTDGVGRADHAWVSPPGGLYLSVLVEPVDPTRADLLPLAVGTELRRRIGDEFGVPTELRWPNDLMHVSPGGDRKLAGVLVDRVYSVDHGAALVVGVGINVQAEPERFPDELRPHVISLAELAPQTPTVEAVEEVAVVAASAAVERLSGPEGARGVIAEGRAALYGRGRRAWVDGKLAGRIHDLGDDGTLWLEGDSGRFALRSGTVSVEGSS